jgi:catechol 2,3-dioxygenase-like lactoylglutathione lyase family enzyme
MIVATGLRPAHVSLGVSDLDVSEKFYRDILGADPVRDDDRLIVTFGSYEFILHAAPPVERAKVRIGFRVDAPEDVDAFAKRVTEHGGVVHSGPANREGGRAVYVSDPDHYQIEFFYAP